MAIEERIEEIMQLVRACESAERDYREALQIDVGVNAAGVTSEAAEKELLQKLNGVFEKIEQLRSINNRMQANVTMGDETWHNHETIDDILHEILD